jgi:hypothetical protein
MCCSQCSVFRGEMRCLPELDLDLCPTVRTAANNTGLGLPCRHACSLYIEEDLFLSFFLSFFFFSFSSLPCFFFNPRNCEFSGKKKKKKKKRKNNEPLPVAEEITQTEQTISNQTPNNILINISRGGGVPMLHWVFLLFFFFVFAIGREKQKKQKKKQEKKKSSSGVCVCTHFTRGVPCRDDPAYDSAEIAAAAVLPAAADCAVRCWCCCCCWCCCWCCCCRQQPASCQLQAAP